MEEKSRILVRAIFILMFCFQAVDLTSQISWDLQNCRTTATLNSVSFCDESNGMIVGDSGLVFRTYDGARKQLW